MARNMGMKDVEAAESSGAVLVNLSGELTRITAEIDALVEELSQLWDGPDAQQFRNNSWPQVKSNLITRARNVEEMGKIAMKNAQAQRDVSANL